MKRKKQNAVTSVKETMNVKSYLETYIEKAESMGDRVLIEIPSDLVTKLYNLGIPKSEIEQKVIHLINSAIEDETISVSSSDDSFENESESSVDDIIDDDDDDDSMVGVSVIEEPEDFESEDGEE